MEEPGKAGGHHLVDKVLPAGEVAEQGREVCIQRSVLHPVVVPERHLLAIPDVNPGDAAVSPQGTLILPCSAEQSACLPHPVQR